MKDARTKRNQKKLEPTSHVGTAVFGATTLAGAGSLAFTARNTAVGQSLVNATLPTLVTTCAAVGAADVIVSLARLIGTHGARKRCKTTVKNIGKVQQIERIAKPQSAEDKDANRIYADYLKKLGDLGEVDDAHLTPILRSIFIDNPNRLQQDVLNNLSFRDLTGEHAVKNALGTVIFDGATKLAAKSDYSLSTVYNVIKLKALLEEAKASYDSPKGKEAKKAVKSNKKGKDGGYINLDALVGAGTDAEKTKLLNQLGHIGITQDTILRVDEIDRIIGVIDKYLEPLKALHENISTNPDGSAKRGLFLESYRLRGKTYQNFGDMFKEGHVGYDIVSKLIDAHAATMDEEDGAEFAKTMREKADKVNDDIAELAIEDEKVIGLRKKMKHNRDYVLDFKLNKDQRALLAREYYLKRNKELNAHFKNGFVTLDWVKDILTTGVEHNRGILKKQYKLAIKICGIAGIPKAKIKKAISDGTIDSLLDKKELEKTVEQIAKGIDFSFPKAETGAFKSFHLKNPQYLITNKYKLKKFTKRRKAIKKVYKSLPEYKKVAKHNQLLGLIKPLGKKIGFGTISGLTLGAGLIGAAFTGVGLPIAIALGATGAVVAGTTLASKIHEIRTGKKFFRIKTDAYEDKAEFAAWKKQNPSKNFAPTQSVTTARFRNNVVAMSESPVKRLGKKFFNAIGWSNFGKPKAEEIDFGALADSAHFEYPHSLISAYDVEGTLDGAKPGISEAVKKAIARGLRHNSEVNFLVDPIEVYIRDKKGKVKAAVHVDQKSLAKNVLGVLLEQYGTSSETTFDVNIGKTRFIVQPSEIEDKDKPGTVDPDRLHATVKRITGYAREEEFRRTIPELYEDVSRYPDAFGIELNEDGEVVANHALAQSVNLNATRFSEDRKQVYTAFDYATVVHKKRPETRVPDVDSVDPDSADDAERLRTDDGEPVGRSAGGSAVGYDDEDEEESLEGRSRKGYNDLDLSEIYEKLVRPVAVGSSEGKYEKKGDDGDTDSKSPKEQFEIINKRLNELTKKVEDIKLKDGSVYSEEIERITAKLRDVGEKIKSMELGDGAIVDPAKIDTDKLVQINNDLDVVEASIEQAEKGSQEKPHKEMVPPFEEPSIDVPSDDKWLEISEKIDKLIQMMESLDRKKGEHDYADVRETREGPFYEKPADIDSLAEKLDKLERLLTDNSSGAKDKDAIKQSIRDARDKVIVAIQKMIFGKYGRKYERKGLIGSVETLLAKRLPNDIVQQIIDGVSSDMPRELPEPQKGQIQFVFDTVKTMSSSVSKMKKKVDTFVNAVYRKDGGAKATGILVDILNKLNGLKPGETIDTAAFLGDIEKAIKEQSKDEEIVEELTGLQDTLFGKVGGTDGKRSGGAIQEIRDNLEAINGKLGDKIDTTAIQSAMKTLLENGLQEKTSGGSGDTGWLRDSLTTLISTITLKTTITEKDKEDLVSKLVAALELNKLPDTVAERVRKLLEKNGLTADATTGKTKTEEAKEQRIATVIVSYRGGRQSAEAYAGLKKVLTDVYGLKDDQIKKLFEEYKIKEPKTVVKNVDETTEYRKAAATYFDAILEPSAVVDIGGENKPLKDVALDRFKNLKTKLKLLNTDITKRIQDLDKKLESVELAREACQSEVLLFRAIIYGTNLLPKTNKNGKMPIKIAMVNELIRQIKESTISIDEIVADLKERLKDLKVKDKTIKEIFDNKLEILAITNRLMDTKNYDIDRPDTSNAILLAEEIAAVNKYRKSPPAATH